MRLKKKIKKSPISHSSNLPRRLLRLTPLLALFAIPSTTMPRSQQGSHRARASGSSNDERICSLLRQHYLGLHKMRLEYVACTEMVRTLNQAASRVSPSPSATYNGPISLLRRSSFHERLCVTASSSSPRARSRSRAANPLSTVYSA